MNTARAFDEAPSHRPDPTASRFRQALPAAHAAAANKPSNTAALNLAQASMEAAECGCCAYFDDENGECHAWPPRCKADGTPVWPLVPRGSWCGVWAGNWRPLP